MRGDAGGPGRMSACTKEGMGKNQIRQSLKKLKQLTLRPTGRETARSQKCIPDNGQDGLTTSKVKVCRPGKRPEIFFAKSWGC